MSASRIVYNWVLAKLLHLIPLFGLGPGVERCSHMSWLSFSELDFRLFDIAHVLANAPFDGVICHEVDVT